MAEQPELIWLTLCEDENSACEIAVPVYDVLRWGVKDFADLYRKTVYKCSKKEAREWGEKQVEERAVSFTAAMRARA